MFGYEYRPPLARAPVDGGAHRSIGLEDTGADIAAVGVRPGVDRVLQHARGPAVGQPAPAQASVPHPGIAAREGPLGERTHHRERGAVLVEDPVHVPDRGLHLLIRVQHDASVAVVDHADRQPDPQPALGRCGASGPVQAPGQQVQLRLAHGRFHAQDQPVVEVRQVVDAVGIDQEGVGQARELQQPCELGRRACQPAHLQGEDRSDLAEAHQGDQLREALAGAGEAARDAQIVIDHHDRLGWPAQVLGEFGQRVLSGGRLGVLLHLHHRGLAQVDHCLAGAVRRPALLRGLRL